ncbi:MAG: hypothetical protein IKU32_08540 [Clostridia bacterium]|nr:hypothetical protein [Clostridia bacterium]
MKKIFAIALALVMVLSMASAFASACKTGPFDWSCATSTNKCGKATVEVVPYVTTNSACNEVAYVESDCAAAINGENVYYALKLTIDKDIDPEWWNEVKLYVSVAGMEANVGKTQIKPNPPTTAASDASEDGWVYYYHLAKGWFEATEVEDFDIATVMNKSVVKEYAKAKVCFYLESKNEFNSATVGDYLITYEKAKDRLIVANEDGSKVVFYMNAKTDKIEDIDVVALAACDTKDAYIKEVLEFLGLGCGYGVCVTEDAINANFGWDDEVKSCFAWKTQNAMAVVDSECVVAIPKTGDASVLAWLF